MVAAGLAKSLLGNGCKVGFFKPLATEGPDGSDGDALFMKGLLKMDEPLAGICPVIGGQDAADGLKTAYDRIAQGRDVIIVEGACQPELITALGAKVIAVESYSGEPSPADLECYRNLGECLLGVAWNKVPAGKLESFLRDPRCGEAGVAVLGALPEDRALSTISVGELAGCLQAAWVRGLVSGAAALTWGP